MPRYTGRPFNVEAHEFNGIVSDLPAHFIPAAEQGQDGTATVDTLTGFVAMMRGDFMLRGVEGFAVMHAATFEAQFARVVEETPAAEGMAMVTYLGDEFDPDATPARMSWMGVNFRLHEAVSVSDPATLKVLAANRHFRVVGADAETMGIALASAVVAPVQINEFAPEDFEVITLGDLNATSIANAERRGPGRPRKVA